MKKNNWLITTAIFSLITLTVFFSGCAGPAEKESLTIAGSTTVQPISIRAAEAYMAANEIDIAVQGGGSGTGIKMVGEGTIDIGASSRELKEAEKEEYPDLTTYAIAGDGIAVIVNPENPIDDLSLEDIRKIFSGEITNFNEVGGENRKIVVVVREDGSGTRATFEDLAMDEAPNSEEVQQKPSNGALKATVAGNENAIGYLGLGYIDSGVKALRIGGVEASEATILDGSYPISRQLYMVTHGEATGSAKDFIDFVLSSEGQDLVEEEGFIRVD